MSINPIHPSQVNNYSAIQPLLESIKSNNGKRPLSGLPSESHGTIQQNADKNAIMDVTLYNAHGILVKTGPNSLIAYV